MRVHAGQARDASCVTQRMLTDQANRLAQTLDRLRRRVDLLRGPLAACHDGAARPSSAARALLGRRGGCDKVLSRVAQPEPLRVAHMEPPRVAHMEPVEGRERIPSIEVHFLRSVVISGKARPNARP
jgi:hypothetical protein